MWVVLGTGSRARCIGITTAETGIALPRRSVPTASAELSAGMPLKTAAKLSWSMPFARWPLDSERARKDSFTVSLAAVSLFGPALVAPAGTVHVAIRVAVASFAGILFNFRWA